MEPEDDEENFDLFIAENMTEETFASFDNNTNASFDFFNVTKQYPIDYAVPLYGYCMPVVSVLTIIANTLVVVVLGQRHMRSPTNAVQMAMALSDMFTVLIPAPWLLYMYTFGNHYKPFHPVSACYAWGIMNEIIPNFLHTACIWLTLALAVQRYIYVCHPPVAHTWCTMPRVMKGICWIYGLATLHQSTRIFDRVYTSVEIIWEGKPHLVCREDLAHWVTDIVTYNVYFTVYFSFRVVFVHLIPCISLVVLNLLLIRAMRKAQVKRDQLFKNKRVHECKRMQDSNSKTIMLIVVVSVFLFVEIPLAVLTILHIISSIIIEFLDYEMVNVCILFSNFFCTASYPINFAIYCGMSQQFRETFKDLFVRGGPRTPNENALSSSVKHLPPSSKGPSSSKGRTIVATIVDVATPSTSLLVSSAIPGKLEMETDHQFLQDQNIDHEELHSRRNNDSNCAEAVLKMNDIPIPPWISIDSSPRVSKVQCALSSLPRPTLIKLTITE